MGRAEARGVVLAHVTDAHVTRKGRRSAALKDRSVEIFTELVDQITDRGVDLTLFGGDNIDNHGDGAGDLEAFTQIAARTGRYLCTVGNHESVAGREGYLSKQEFISRLPGHGLEGERPCFSESVGNVRVIGIDTTLVGTAGGYVAPGTMKFLADELRRAEEEHIVVMGHHLLYRSWEPLTLHAWDKDYLVANRDTVTALLASHPRVRAYLCGHHHASRIQRIAARGASGGFYHMLTSSPVSYPHLGRILRFEEDGIHVESIGPKDPELIEAGKVAVQSGRKAQRFESLGSQRTFLHYVGGRASDNDAVLPYDHAPVSIAPRPADSPAERRRPESLAL
jgi:DNA repair exonuclease SbcCD nuclease subunit